MSIGILYNVSMVFAVDAQFLDVSEKGLNVGRSRGKIPCLITTFHDSLSRFHINKFP